QMIDGVASMVQRIAQNRAEFARKGVGDHRLALDQTGIAVARLLSGPSAIDQDHVAAALLQMQRDTDADHPRPEDDHVSAHIRTRSFPGSDNSGLLQLLNL